MHKMTEGDRIRAVKTLKRALPAGTRLRALDPDRDPLLYVVDLDEVPPFAIRLAVEQEPLAAQLAIPGQEDAVPVVVLRTRRSRNREHLRRSAQSFIDLAGAVHLRVPGFYLDRTDLPPAPESQAEKSGADPYTDKASRIARALLASPTRRRWSTQELAGVADVDVSTASRAIRELRRRGLVRDESPGQGRRSRIWVPEPEALLQDWTRSYSWKDNPQLRVAAPVGAPRRSVMRMSELFPSERWAFSLQAGASLIAPHADFDVIHVYVETPSLNAYVADKEWEITPTGKLCLLDSLYAQSVWYQRRTVKGQPVVSTVQLVLDLWHYPVRGREQAEHLLETVMRPRWNAPDDSD